MEVVGQLSRLVDASRARAPELETSDEEDAPRLKIGAVVSTVGAAVVGARRPAARPSRDAWSAGPGARVICEKADVVRAPCPRSPFGLAPAGPRREAGGRHAACQVRLPGARGGAAAALLHRIRAARGDARLAPAGPPVAAERARDAERSLDAEVSLDARRVAAERVRAAPDAAVFVAASSSDDDESAASAVDRRTSGPSGASRIDRGAALRRFCRPGRQPRRFACGFPSPRRRSGSDKEIILRASPHDPRRRYRVALRLHLVLRVGRPACPRGRPPHSRAGRQPHVLAAYSPGRRGEGPQLDADCVDRKKAAKFVAECAHAVADIKKRNGEVQASPPPGRSRCHLLMTDTAVGGVGPLRLGSLSVGCNLASAKTPLTPASSPAPPAMRRRRATSSLE